MSLFFKIVLIIFALTYFISPIDILPDFLFPYIGYLDDLGIFALVLYILKYGQLPAFFPDKVKNGFNSFKNFYSQSHKEKMKNFSGPYTDNKNANNRNDFKKQSNKPSPWQILGISEGASREKIQAAYKEAVKKYHPDKVSHLGPEFRKLANDKFVEIQAAYHSLIKHH